VFLSELEPGDKRGREGRERGGERKRKKRGRKRKTFNEKS
jgi:hypothetical protein